jgi:hypothetical protein
MSAEDDEDEDELFDEIDRAVSAYTRTPVAHRRRRAYGDEGHAAGGSGDGSPDATRTLTAAADACTLPENVGSVGRGGASSRAPRKRAAHQEPHEPRRQVQQQHGSRTAGHGLPRHDRPTSRRHSSKPAIPRQGRTDRGDTNAEAAASREHRARTRALARKISARYGRSAEGLQAAADLLRTESAQDELEDDHANESSHRAAARGPAMRASQPAAADGGAGSQHQGEPPEGMLAGTRAETVAEEVVVNTSIAAEVGERTNAAADEDAPAAAHFGTYERVLSATQSGTLSSVLQCTDQTRATEAVPCVAIDAAGSAQQIRAVRNGWVPGAWESSPQRTNRAPGAKMQTSEPDQLRDLMSKARGVEEQLSRRLQTLVDKERKVSQRSSKLAARAEALSTKEAKADDREAELEQRAVSLSKRESAADFARRQSQLSAQEQKVAARLAEANKRVLQAEQAESAAQAAQVDLDRREADLAAAKSATDRRNAVLNEVTAATEVRRQMVTEGTLRLTSDADRLR